MPKQKKVNNRLELLNRCLRSRWYSYDELILLVREELLENITIRTLQNDFNELRSASVEENYDPLETRIMNRIKEFRYKDKNYSYFDPLVDERQMLILQEVVAILNKHKGIELADEVIEIITHLQKKNFEKLEVNSAYFQPAYFDGYTGHEFLLDMLESCRHQTVLKMNYKGFGKKEQEIIFHPAILKEWKGRWFVIGKVELYDTISIYALDRIISIKPQRGVSFLQQDINILNQSLEEIIGISLSDAPIENIQFFMNHNRSPYLQTKPIHKSQKVVSINDDGCIFQLEIRPNKELFTFFLECGPDLVVLSPANVVDEMKNLVTKLFNNYVI